MRINNTGHISVGRVFIPSPKHKWDLGIPTRLNKSKDDNIIDPEIIINTNKTSDIKVYKTDIN
jgi:hypothetical protein